AGTPGATRECEARKEEQAGLARQPFGESQNPHPAKRPAGLKIAGNHIVIRYILSIGRVLTAMLECRRGGTMRAKSSDSPRSYLLPPEPQRVDSLRRSNLVCIAILAFFTLGLVVAGFVEASDHASQASKAPPTAVHAYQAHHGARLPAPAAEPETRPN